MELPIEKIQALAARRLTEQQIADVLDIDFRVLKEDREALRRYREEIRKGASRGEAELKSVLYKRAKDGSAFAYESLKNRKNQDSS